MGRGTKIGRREVELMGKGEHVMGYEGRGIENRERKENREKERMNRKGTASK